MTPQEILIAAKAKIDTPDKWTKGDFAQNSDGDPVPSKSPYAVCFCSLGALYSLDIPPDLLGPVYDALDKAMGDETVTHFNDTHTHSQVMAAWDKAIEASK